MRTGRSLFFGIAALAACSPYSAAQGPSAARHAYFVETEYAPDGAIRSTRFSVEAWRADGSHAEDSYTVGGASAEPWRQRSVTDLRAGEATVEFHFLGVRTVAPISEEAAERRRKRLAACSVSDDPLIRTIDAPNGERTVLRFDPTFGCSQVETTVTDAGGRLVRTRRMLGVVRDGAPEGLFVLDEALRAVSREEIVRIQAAHFGAPASTAGRND